MKYIKNLFCITSISLVTTFLISCDRSPSYLSFVKRDSNYYAGIAQACDKLLSEIPENVTNQILTVSTDDKSLPPIIQKLHASKIQVARNLGALWQDGTNYESYVSIMIGAPRGGFGIHWSQNDYGSGYMPWELCRYAEGLRTVLFSTKEPTWRKIKKSDDQIK